MGMDVDLYQASTQETAIYPCAGTGADAAIVYCMLGLVGEAGEAAEVVKKYLRGDHHQEHGGLYAKEILQSRLRSELGDVIWYWCRLLAELGVDASFVLQDNLDKIRDRASRDAIHGSGETR